MTFGLGVERLAGRGRNDPRISVKKFGSQLDSDGATPVPSTRASSEFFMRFTEWNKPSALASVRRSG